MSQPSLCHFGPILEPNKSDVRAKPDPTFIGFNSKPDSGWSVSVPRQSLTRTQNYEFSPLGRTFVISIQAPNLNLSIRISTTYLNLDFQVSFTLSEPNHSHFSHISYTWSFLFETMSQPSLCHIGSVLQPKKSVVAPKPDPALFFFNSEPDSGWSVSVPRQS